MNEGRESHRRRWRLALPSLIGIAVLLIVVVFAVWRSQQPVFHSGGGKQVVLYHGQGFDFAYPQEWRVIAPYQHYGLHGPSIIAVVGSGDFDSGCAVTNDGVSCSHGVVLAVADGEVVLAYHLGAWLGHPLPSPSLGPGEEWGVVGGRPAIFSQTPTSLRWAFPGAPEYIDVRFAPDVARDARQQVLRLISTWRWAATYSPH